MTSVDSTHDLLVVGGGPAGISAATAAASAGLSVVLVDERPALGGQIYKQPGPGFTVPSPEAMDRQYRAGLSLVRSLDGTTVDVRLRTSVVAVEGRESILVEDGASATSVITPRTVVAAGAHDRPVVFPGWTLPGVITAGGLQALVKTQRVLPGNRMVFAGSGPVALAFPAQLAHFGAHIVEALEAGPEPQLRDLVRVAGAARGNATVLRDAIRYRSSLLRHRVPLRYRRMVIRAEGDGRVERVVHAAVDSEWRPVPGTERVVDADLLCLGYGFVPSLEMLRLRGCTFDYDEDLGGQVVRRDRWMRTSVDSVYAAGDGAGVEGVYVARDEGAIAGIGAAMDSGAISAADADRMAAEARRRIRRRRSLAAATLRLFRVGRGVYELATPDTVVCRCESVRASLLAEAIDATDDINVVKALTRAGMGPCQGRNCQRHIAAAIAQRYDRDTADIPFMTPRMPLRPTPIRAIADHSIASPGLFVAESEDEHGSVAAPEQEASS